MITHNDQMDIFRLISKNLKKDVVCYAFGGTAMMFFGYKDDTKDVDLLFEDESAQQELIRILKKLGFNETSPIIIYIPEKLRDKHKPLIFKRDDARFDLFVKKIFRTQLSPKMKEDIYAIHEFRDKHTLTVRVLRTEYIVQLKAITNRKNDFDDIRNIISKDKYFNWQYFIDEVIWQYQHGDNWALLDTEKMMKELKKYFFIEQKYFKQLYKAKK